MLASSSDERFPPFRTSHLQGAGIQHGRLHRPGVAVPMETPPEVVAVLEKAFLLVVTDPPSSRHEGDGFVPLAMGHEESMAYIPR